jgi:hypothetical protein
VFFFNTTDESDISNYLNKNIQASCDQSILLGTTCRIMADALSREPACLSDLEENKVNSILTLSGSNAENTETVSCCIVCLLCAALRTKWSLNKRVLFCQFKICLKAGIVAHSCKPSIWEAPPCTELSYKVRPGLKNTIEMKWWIKMKRLTSFISSLLYGKLNVPCISYLLFELNLFCFVLFFFFVCLFVCASIFCIPGMS